MTAFAYLGQINKERPWRQELGALLEVPYYYSDSAASAIDGYAQRRCAIAVFGVSQVALKEIDQAATDALELISHLHLRKAHRCTILLYVPVNLHEKTPESFDVGVAIQRLYAAWPNVRVFTHLTEAAKYINEELSPCPSLACPR